MEFISTRINQLMNGDLLRRVDALVDINDAIGALSNKAQASTPGGADSAPSTDAEY